MVVPEEGEQVAPVLDAGPFVAAVAPHEALEHPVDRVYRIHRVLAVRKALRLARRVNDSSHSEFLHQQRMASFAVVDHHAASLDVGAALTLSKEGLPNPSAMSMVFSPSVAVKMQWTFLESPRSFSPYLRKRSEGVTGR